MGLGTETLKHTFPRSAEALKKHNALIDRTALSEQDRKALKASVSMLVIVVAEEVGTVREHMKSAVGTVAVIRGLFGRGRK